MKLHAQALWKEMGGSEVAWDVWSKPQVTKGEELTDGRWEKATKAMPAFELSDVSGKTWRMKELGGNAFGRAAHRVDSKFVQGIGPEARLVGPEGVFAD